MPIAPGTPLGPYEILAAIGSGGMGDVYRAKDTRLRREVAIKVLPPHVTSDPAKRQRFEREAQAIAALSHPHICALFDIGSQGGTEYLVMEHLEGETLERRLVRGALPLEHVVRHAIEIADALDHAHRHGIVHRDLKPSNIMLTKGGAKLLDFGLAKWHEREPVIWGPGSGELRETWSLTAEGTILGTLQYMAPEQLEGKDADARADLFALGVVVYEMITGRRAFIGSSHAGLIAAILTTDPVSLTALEPLVPPGLERIVKKCLAKDPDVRWQTARDLLDGLKWVAEGVRAPERAGPRRRARLAWFAAAVAGLLSLTAAASGLISPAPTAIAERAVRFIVSAPEGATFNDSSGFMALSPDGRSLAFSLSSRTGETALWVRSLDSPTARQIPGTGGGSQPFWSPDGRSLGFLTEQSLKTIDETGGLAQTLVDTPGAYTGTWNREGVLVFMLAPNRQAGLYQVRATGGAATPVTTLDEGRGETAHVWPQFLPDGRRFLFTALSRQPEHHRVLYVGSLDSTDRVRLFIAESRAEYVSPGYLVYARGPSPVSDKILGGTLVAQSFDAARLRVTGDPIRIAGPVDLTRDLGRGAFSMSQTGVLAYSPVAASGLGWYDRSGTLLQSIGPAANPALSPDGQRLAVSRADPDTGGSSIWVMDVTGGNASRLTRGPLDDMPLWSPDGRRIGFMSDRDQGPGLYQIVSSGAGSAEVLLQPPAERRDWNLQPSGWSADGRSLVYKRSNPATNTDSDIGMLSLAGNRSTAPLIQTEFTEAQGVTSPDGRWIAYVSSETGRLEVYVRPFPSGDGKRKISVGGGMEPAWRRDGQEIFYLAPDRHLMAVAVTTNPAFDARPPSRLFETRMTSTLLNPPGSRRNQYAVSADGQRFLIHQPPEGRPLLPITVVVNWTPRRKDDLTTRDVRIANTTRP